jgi:hypothetical protein
MKTHVNNLKELGSGLLFGLVLACFPILLADVPVNAQEVTARRVHQALPQPSMANSSRRLIRNSAV